jgi:putative phosphoribosyl transferase
MEPDMIYDESVRVRLGTAEMGGVLSLPEKPAGVVLFVRPSGGRRSFQDRLLASRLHGAGLGTLLADLVTPLEALEEYRRLNIPLLAERVAALTEWLASRLEGTGLRIGFFGAAQGGAAAIEASLTLGDAVGAIVSRDGCPELVPDALPQVRSPTLLIARAGAGGGSFLTLRAYNRLRATKELALIRGSAHLLEEPRAFEKVALLAAGWFRRFLPTDLAAPVRPF